jgi:hypothetical protein
MRRSRWVVSSGAETAAQITAAISMKEKISNSATMRSFKGGQAAGATRLPYGDLASALGMPRVAENAPRPLNR